MTVVLDTSAVLAVIRRELGRDRVVEILPRAIVSTVNYAEVIGNLVIRGMPANIAQAEFAGLRIRTVPFDDEQAVETGGLRRFTHHLNLSLGDRACLALARTRQAAVLTSDRRWAEFDFGVPVRQIR
jgi:PIN domain nuclease of toxin-antitoxin system